MVESQQVLEWIAEGELKGRAEALLHLLALRFPPGAPADLAAQIREAAEPEQLRRWFDAAYAAPSLEAFREVMSR